LTRREPKAKQSSNGEHAAARADEQQQNIHEVEEAPELPRVQESQVPRPVKPTRRFPSGMVPHDKLSMISHPSAVFHRRGNLRCRDPPAGSSHGPQCLPSHGSARLALARHGHCLAHVPSPVVSRRNWVAQVKHGTRAHGTLGGIAAIGAIGAIGSTAMGAHGTAGLRERGGAVLTSPSAVACAGRRRCGRPAGTSSTARTARTPPAWHTRWSVGGRAGGHSTRPQYSAGTGLLTRRSVAERWLTGN
jgi:hypothetical protein